MKTFNGVYLTGREKEILSCIAYGLNSKQIAGKLFISHHTVTKHRKNMLAKTGTRNSSELVEKIFKRDFN